MATPKSMMPSVGKETKSLKERNFIAAYRLLDLDERDNKANADLQGIKKVINPKSVYTNSEAETLNQQMLMMTKNLAKPYFWARIFNLLSVEHPFMQSLGAAVEICKDALKQLENQRFEDQSRIALDCLPEFLKTIPLALQKEFDTLIRDNKKLITFLENPVSIRISKVEGYNNATDLKAEWQNFYKILVKKFTEGKKQFQELDVHKQKYQELYNVVKANLDGYLELGETLYSAYNDLYYSQRTAAAAFLNTNKDFDLSMFPLHHLVGALYFEAMNTYGTIEKDNPVSQRHFEKVAVLCNRLNECLLMISKCNESQRILLGWMKSQNEEEGEQTFLDIKKTDLESSIRYFEDLQSDIKVNLNILMLGLEQRKNRWANLSKNQQAHELLSVQEFQDRERKTNADGLSQKTLELAAQQKLEMDKLEQSFVQEEARLSKQNNDEKLKTETELRVAEAQELQSLEIKLKKDLSELKEKFDDNIQNCEIGLRAELSLADIKNAENTHWISTQRSEYIQKKSESFAQFKTALEIELKMNLEDVNQKNAEQKKKLNRTYESRLERSIENLNREKTRLSDRQEIKRKALQNKHQHELKVLGESKDSRAVIGLLHEQLYPLYFEALKASMYFATESHNGLLESNLVLLEPSDPKRTEYDKKRANDTVLCEVQKAFRSLFYLKAAQSFEDFNPVSYENHKKPGKLNKDKAKIAEPKNLNNVHKTDGVVIEKALEVLLAYVKKDYKLLAAYNLSYFEKLSALPKDKRGELFVLGDHFDCTTPAIKRYLGQNHYRDYVVTPDLTTQRLFCSFRGLTNMVSQSVSQDGFLRNMEMDTRRAQLSSMLARVRATTKLRDLVLEYLLPFNEMGEFDLAYHLGQGSMGYVASEHRYDALPYSRTADACLTELLAMYDADDQREAASLISAAAQSTSVPVKSTATLQPKSDAVDKAGGKPLTPAAVKHVKQMTHMYSRYTQTLAVCLTADSAMENARVEPKPIVS